MQFRTIKDHSLDIWNHRGDGMVPHHVNYSTFADLQAKVEELEALVVEAYHEGYDDAYSECNTGREPDDCVQFSPASGWHRSDVKKKAEGGDDE